MQVTGSANTLVRRDDGKFTAANTDFAAAIDSLKAHLSERAKDGPVVQLSQLSVLILGGGGVARSIKLTRATPRRIAAHHHQPRTYRQPARSKARRRCEVQGGGLARPPQHLVRRARQLHPSGHAPERGRSAVSLQHPEAGDDCL